MSIKPERNAAPSPLMKNAVAAPTVYFDTVPVYGTFGGVIEIELAQRILMPKADGGVTADMSCASHLRCSPQGAMVLVDALTKALAMLAKQNEQPKEKLS